MGKAGRPMGTQVLFFKEKELERLYIEEKLPMRRIAEIFNCGLTTVRRNIRRFGIPTRSISEGTSLAMQLREKYKKESKYRNRRRK
jgi:hypothetical protein